METHSRSENEPFHQQQDVYESGEEAPDTHGLQQPRRPEGQLQRKDAGLRETSQSSSAENLAGNAVETRQQNREKERNDALRLRLDLNLDVEITLKARIHGDLELALLEG